MRIPLFLFTLLASVALLNAQQAMPVSVTTPMQVSHSLSGAVSNNNLSIGSYVSLTDFETTGIFDYGVWPISQLIPLEMAAAVHNNGPEIADEVTLNVHVNGEPVSTTSTPVSIAPFGLETVRASGWTPPSNAGTYTVQLAAVTGEDDEVTGVNSVTRTLEVSEHIYARDHGVITGSFPQASYSEEFLLASNFQFFAETTIYAIDVALTAADAGALIYAGIHDLNLNFIEFSEPIAVDPSLINNGVNETGLLWTTIPLETPFTVPANTEFIASIGSYGQQGIRVGTSIPAPQLSSFIYGYFGPFGFFDWYFTESTFMIRLNLNPEFGLLGCTDAQACNYNPDATINDGSCDYVTLGVISGPNSPEAGTAEVYSYPNQVGSTFNWTATNGTLTSGQGTATATVLWSEEGSGSVCVTETRDDQCTGEEVCFTVNVLPNNITEHTQETIQVYPNPFDGAVTIAQSGIKQNHLHVYDSMGRRVFERSIQKTEVIDLSSLPSGLYQVAIVSLNGALLHRSALVKQ